MDNPVTARRPGRVTIKDVAADAGVSVAAVSKVLRDAYGVSDALRAKVRASMEKLSYRPLASARGMRGQTFTLGVLLPDLRNPFFSNLMAGVNQALEATQYQPLLGVGQSAESLEHALVENMIDRGMDGLILVAPRLRYAEIDSIGRRIPTVLIGAHEPQATTFDTVNNDDRLSARLVVRHLHDEGYRRIAYFSLTLPETLTDATIVYRELGYRDAMKELGLGRSIRVVPAEQSTEATRDAARALLTSRNPPEAIFCWTDFIALEVLSVARNLGLSVPGDVAIVGHDNTAYCELEQNSLTSVDQSGEVLGLQSARLLIERIRGRTRPEHFVITPRVVARRSSQGRRSSR